MLDGIQPTTELEIARNGWQDAQCLAAGDEHVQLAIRCYEAGLLWDDQITRRVLDVAGIAVQAQAETPETWTAAEAVARHCALMDLPLRRIIAILAYLAVEIPAFPDGDTLGEIAELAVKECAA
jgi:hypothetical protein